MRHLLVLLALLAGGVPATADSAGSWSGRMVEEDGVLHAYNPAEPFLAEKILVPEEVFRIQGESDEYLLGVTGRVHLDERDHTYLFDSQLNCIWIFDEQGNFLRAIGREGEAPGEWTRAYNMLLMPDGRIAVVQTMPTRLVMLSREGEPLDDHPLPEVPDGGVRMLMGSECANSNLVLELVKPAFDGVNQIDHARVVGVNPDGSERCLYGESTTTTSTTRIVLGRDRNGVAAAWSLGADGVLHTAPAHREFRIESYNREARLLRVIHREYETLALDESDRERLKKRVSFAGMSEPEFEFAPDACSRDIQRFIVRDNGEIWVRSSQVVREFGEAFLIGSEVFDPQGRLLCRVTVNLEFDEDRDAPVILGDRLYLLRNIAGMWESMRRSLGSRTLGGEEQAEDEDEDIEFEIICYSLPYVCEKRSP